MSLNSFNCAVNVFFIQVSRKSIYTPVRMLPSVPPVLQMQVFQNRVTFTFKIIFCGALISASVVLYFSTQGKVSILP